jgi:hypothetical protein
MSVELYQSICKWFLHWSNMQGVFGFCFTVLSWNLACRASNTADICLNEISWATTFDAYEVFFAHTKTDQTGEESKYPRHLYANPLQPLSCPVFALSLYFSCCFNTTQTAESHLFPGTQQYQRYKEMLAKVLKDHEAKLFPWGMLWPMLERIQFGKELFHIWHLWSVVLLLQQHV